MSKNILVAYASRCGSTAETAELIASELSLQNNIFAEAIPVKTVKNVALYDAVILGSAIWMGKPLPEMFSFVKSYQPILSSKKVACFGLCMALKDDTQEARNESASYLARLSEFCVPLDSRIFPGKVDLSRMKFFARLVLKMAKTPVGDFRKFDEIKTWAHQIGTMLA